MRLKTLSFNNITRFKEFEFDFSIVPDGCVGISGENGSGKTTILEVICYCLTCEMPSRDVSIYDVLNDSESTIDLIYDLDGKEFHHKLYINREKRKQEGYIYIDSLPVVEGKITDYKSYCRDHIVDPKMFYASIFNSQNNSGNFVNISTSDRKKLIIDALGLNKLQLICSQSRDIKKDISGKISGISSMVIDRDSILEDIENCEENIVKVKDKIETYKYNKNEILSKLEVFNNNLSSLKDRRNVCEYDLNLEKDRLNKYNNLISSINTLKNEINDIESKAGSLPVELNKLKESRKSKLEEAEGIESKISDLYDKFNDLQQSLDYYKSLMETSKKANDGIKNKLQLAVDKVDKLNQEVLNHSFEMKGDLDSIKNMSSKMVLDYKKWKKQKLKDIDRLNLELDEKKKQTKTLNDVPCGEKYPDCHLKSFAHEAKDKIPNIESQIEDIQIDIDVMGVMDFVDPLWNKLLSRYKSLRSDHKTLLKRLETSDKEKNEIDKAVQHSDKELKEFESKLDLTRSEWDKVRENIRSLSSRKNNLINEINNIDNRMYDINDSMASLNSGKLNGELKSLEDIAKRDFGDTDINKNIIKIEASINELTDKINDINSDITKYNNEICTIDKSIKDLESIVIEDQQLIKYNKEKLRESGEQQEKLEALNLDLSDYIYIENAFGPNGIQALEIDAAGPSISDLTNLLLQSCYGSRFNVQFVTTEQKVSSNDFKEVFTVKVYDSKTNHTGDIRGLSGGEQTIVSIAIQLAMALFNLQKTGIPFKTLILDEITSALSEDNCCLCVDMLKKACQVGGFSHVIFTSHSNLAIERSDCHLRLEEGILNPH